MNKRQEKKARKKVVYPLVDEFNLLSMNEKEVMAARKEYDDYVREHFRYFHYRDKYKVARKPCHFRYPVGEAAKEYFAGMLKRVRRYEGPSETIVQDISQFKMLPQESK